MILDFFPLIRNAFSLTFLLVSYIFFFFFLESVSINEIIRGGVKISFFKLIENESREEKLSAMSHEMTIAFP